MDSRLSFIDKAICIKQNLNAVIKQINDKSAARASLFNVAVIAELKEKLHPLTSRPRHCPHGQPDRSYRPNGSSG